MPTLTCPVSSLDHVIGPADAPVTIVNYVDFHCHECREAYPSFQALRRGAGAAVRVVFRHFPLTEFHRTAPPAAQLAESAAAEGMFWDMHDALLERPPLRSVRALLACARELGLDAARVAYDLEQGAHVSRVNSDFIGGVQSGVHATPAVFINGVRHEGAWDLASLERAIAILAGPERANRTAARPAFSARVVRRAMKSSDDFRWFD